MSTPVKSGAPAVARPYAAQLRASGTIELAPAGTAGALRLRVQMTDTLDVIGVVALPTEPVLALKVRALEHLYPQADFHDDFVLKLRGWDVLDENASLGDCGAVDGSILLLTHRRRRPIR